MKKLFLSILLPSLLLAIASNTVQLKNYTKLVIQGMFTQVNLIQDGKNYISYTVDESEALPVVRINQVDQTVNLYRRNGSFRTGFVNLTVHNKKLKDLLCAGPFNFYSPNLKFMENASIFVAARITIDKIQAGNLNVTLAYSWETSLSIRKGKIKNLTLQAMPGLSADFGNVTINKRNDISPSASEDIMPN